MNRNYEIILKVLEEHKKATLSNIEELSGLARRTIQRTIARLIDDGLVYAEGKTKSRIFKKSYSAQAQYNSITVLKDAEIAGELKYNEFEYIFEYADKYNGTPFIGLSKERKNVSVDFFPYFENLIPEYERREKLLFGKSNIAEAMLELNNAHGSIEFVKTQELFRFESQHNNKTKRPNWIEFKSKILGLNDFPNILDYEIEIESEILEAHSKKEYSNLSGYQHKIDIDIVDAKIVLSKNPNYLMKPKNKDKTDYFNRGEEGTKNYFPYLALNEHLFMSFAKNELGMDVPYSGIIKAKGGDFHYIAKRYDRFNGFKYDQRDFAQLLEVVSSDKYKSNNEELFKKIDETLTSEDEKIKALKFYFYSYIMKHSDLHLKNIGLLEVSKNKFILAPLYDLISVGVYNGNVDDLGLPFKSPYKKPRNLNIDDFYKLSELLHLSKKKAYSAMKEVLSIYIKNFPLYIEKIIHMESLTPLKMQKSRNKEVNFSDRLTSLYDEKIISLKKTQMIQGLGLLELAGGSLRREKNHLERED